MPPTAPMPTDRPDLLPDALHGTKSEKLSSTFPILVAVAADDCTPSTLKVANALASQRGAVPTLLYVMELVPYAMMDGTLGTAVLVDNLLDPTALQHDEQKLRVACGANTGALATWPFEIELGESASSITRKARLLNAKLIVMGFHHHGSIGRMVGADTLREVMALGEAPVLAVRPPLTELPKSVVVAMDFSRASLRAARLARDIMDVNGTMHLVFVDSTDVDEVSESNEGQRLIQTNGVDIAFEQAIAALHPSPGMTIIPMRRSGLPAFELTAVCEELQPELLAIRHPFMERLRIGSVATALVKDGRWSMLVTPPARPIR